MGRSAGEGIVYPLQYSSASPMDPMDQLVKNLPAMWATWVRSLGWENPLEKGKLLQYPGLENPMVWIVSGVAESDTTERLSHSATWEAYHSSFDLICSVTKLCQLFATTWTAARQYSLSNHYLLKLAHTHVHFFDDAIHPSHPPLPPSPPTLNLSQHQGLFQ